MRVCVYACARACMSARVRTCVRVLTPSTYPVAVSAACSAHFMELGLGQLVLYLAADADSGEPASTSANTSVKAAWTASL